MTLQGYSIHNGTLHALHVIRPCPICTLLDLCDTNSAKGYARPNGRAYKISNGSNLILLRFHQAGFQSWGRLKKLAEHLKLFPLPKVHKLVAKFDNIALTHVAVKDSRLSSAPSDNRMMPFMSNICTLQKACTVLLKWRP